MEIDRARAGRGVSASPISTPMSALRGLQWTGQPLGDVHLTAASEGPVLRAHLDPTRRLRRAGRWRVAPGRRLSRQRHGRFFQPGFRPIARLDGAFASASAAARFAGSAEGQLRIDGPALKPQLMKAELRISKFEIGPAPDAGLPSRRAGSPQLRPPGGHHGQLRRHRGERPPGRAVVRFRPSPASCRSIGRARWIFA